MTKAHVHEGVREEAARLDALEEKGALDELPFTPLRRYAKEPSQVYAIRIPVSRLRAIRWLADRRKEQPTALLREWVLERLDEELSPVGPGHGREISSPYASARPRKAVSSRGKRVAAKKATKKTKKASRKGAPAKKR